MKKTPVVLLKLALAVAVALLTVLNLFEGLDALLTDRLYSQLSGPDRDIVLITVDEETLREYGTFSGWSREKTAELLERLYSDSDNMPAVVVLDVMYVSEREDAPETDARLARAAALGDTVTASHIVYRGQVKQNALGEYYYDDRNIEFVEEPYDALKAVTHQGFSNSLLSADGFVRTAMSRTEFEGKEYQSLAFKVYSLYCEKKGEAVVPPVTDSLSQFRFFYSGEPGEFQHFSLSEVLAGRVRADLFKDRIVLFGAYAPAMQDDYPAVVSKGERMYGVEIHANIIQALLMKKTAVKANAWILFFAVFAVSAACLLTAPYRKLLRIIIDSVVAGVLACVLGRILATKGFFIPLLYLLLFFVLSDIYYVILKYFVEKWRRKRTLEVFKKYVAPQVVEDISKSGDFVLKLGGERRDVAVLFVDIRGFTPLSESMEPEQVVAILNEYLALTTSSILGHKGTLDKFIGDATMAVFNAPFDQQDYIYEAVCAAWDIKQGSRELGERLLRDFGKQVGFGVGVNCGPAVVGNIGCDFRMDYTAIGDTVNTAARLEANAKAEEILISEYVYMALKDRIEAEEVGEIPLKGKSTKLMVYRVLNIKKNEAENEG